MGFTWSSSAAKKAITKGVKDEIVGEAAGLEGWFGSDLKTALDSEIAILKLTMVDTRINSGIIVAQSEWDYESADSVTTHLRSRGLINDIYLFIPKEFIQKTRLTSQMLI